MRLLTTICGMLFGALMVMAQRPIALSASISGNSAFDTLPAWYDRSQISVDPTVMINDSLWMAILWIGDADSVKDVQGGWLHTGGVCEYVLLMTVNPRNDEVKDYRQIRTECDIEQGDTEAIYYTHEVVSPTVVEVISSKPVWSGDLPGDYDVLVPFEVRTFKVLPTGAIADVGTGAITEPRLWKP